MNNPRLLITEEVVKALTEANENYKLSREHYLVLNSDIELNALLQAGDTKSVKARDKEWVEWIRNRPIKSVYDDGAKRYRLYEIGDTELMGRKP